MLFPVNVNVPLPSCTKLPVPLIDSAKGHSIAPIKGQGSVVGDIPGDASSRSAVAELQRSSTDRRTAGVGVGAGQGQTCPRPNLWSQLPVPLITPRKVTELLRSKARIPLSVTFPVMLPRRAAVADLECSCTERGTAPSRYGAG